MTAARITVYQGLDGLHRWRLQARNGRIIADSGEGYVSRRGAWRAVAALKRAVAGL